MKCRVLICATAVASAACRAQIELAAHPPPANNGLLEPAGLFFDLQALRDAVVIEALTTGNTAAAGQPFHFDVLVRDGTALGGSATTGPGSSLDGWTLLGTVEGVQGPHGGEVSQVVQLPRFVVRPGHTTGVALWFNYDWGVTYFSDTGSYLHYQDDAVSITTGDARSFPFVVGQGYYPGRALVGSILYELSPCYPNCDGSTLAPVLNINDFICFMTKFAQDDPYANCDQSTTPPVLNVGDFVCFTQQFAGGCS